MRIIDAVGRFRDDLSDPPGKGPAARSEIEDLYRRYGALVRRRAYGLLGSDQEAQDATQEVFVRVIGAMAEFRGQSQPSTWLYRITTNLCLNRIRDGKRRRERLTQAAEAGGGPLAAAPPSPSAEARTSLRSLLERLPVDLARVAAHYFVDEMDQAEIAALMGVSRRTIGYRLDRFRTLAQAIIDEGTAADPPSGVPRTEAKSR